MRKNAIVCLIRGHQDRSGYHDLIERNRSLEENYSSFLDCDNLIFHQGDVTSDHQRYISEATENCTFIELPPNCFSQSFADRFLPYENRWRIGYKHMCRFFAVQVYDLLGKYDAYWRLDDDCLLHGELTADPFQDLTDNDCLYGYVRKKLDGHGMTRATLPPTVEAYLVERYPEKLGQVDVSATNYYNNFHVSRVGFWLRPEVKNFLEYIDGTGGIYKYRWGDSTIQAIAFRIFSEPGELYRYAEIKYEHKSHNWKNFKEV